LDRDGITGCVYRVRAVVKRGSPWRRFSVRPARALQRLRLVQGPEISAAQRTMLLLGLAGVGEKDLITS
jgi:hypothetical protein